MLGVKTHHIGGRFQLPQMPAKGIALLMLLALVGSVGGSSHAAPAGQGQQAQVPGSRSRTFSETGKTVNGVFLDYWEARGGLAQQGFPISDPMREVSDLDRKEYTVQYFERAVFELHPENAAPNNVLLSQLGAFRYRQKYPQGAPNQKANQTGGRLFPETGKWVGGKFLKYWQERGGLAQQGYPISDEFTERSDTDSKTYVVQYFERAVFEDHPENAAPSDVLLSLLGAFSYKEKYAQKPSATPIAPTVQASPTAAPPAATAIVTATPNRALPCTANLALLTNGGRIVDFSSSRFGRLDPNGLIDGDESNGWGSAEGERANQYVSIALPRRELYKVNAIRFNPHSTISASEPGDNNSVKDFQIRMSTTTETFNSYRTVFRGSTPKRDAFYEFTFPPSEARYVMLFVSSNHGGTAVEAAELEVYGPCE